MPMPCYTEAQLRSPNGPHLPGLWTEGRMDALRPADFFSNSDWNPVLNLAVVAPQIGEDGKTQLRILTGSRPETEQTHPNVVSTPTQRILDSEMLYRTLEAGAMDNTIGHYDDFADLMPPFHLGEINPQKPAVIGEFEPYPRDVTGGWGIEELVAKILAEKLGFDAWYDPVNRQRLYEAGLYPSLGQVSLSRLVAGFSYVGDTMSGEPLYEPIVMIGAVLHTKYPHLFPRSTPHYNNLTFTPLAPFAENVRERRVENLLQLDNASDLVQMCVRGLCLSTCVQMSLAEDLDRYTEVDSLGTLYDDHHTETLLHLWEYNDKNGREVAARISAVLGRNVLAEERVDFVRSLWQESNDNKPGVERTWRPVTDQEAAEILKWAKTLADSVHQQVAKDS